MPENGADSVREISHELIRVIDQHEDSELQQAITPLFERLLERPDLLVLGVERRANHIPWSSYLYYDGALSLTMNYLPKGYLVPVHDHGTWEAVAVYRGSIEHTLYRRADTDERPGRAELEQLDKSTMDIADLEVVAPPDDIHGFVSLEEDTYFAAAYLNRFKPDRHYYQPGRGTYLIRHQQAWRATK